MLSGIIQPLIDFLKSFSSVVPLPVFTFLGAFIEEVIAPIPSPLVMTLAGSIAFTQNSTWITILFLAVVGSIGKTLGSYIIYVISKSAEEIVVSKFGKFIGVTSREINAISKHLNKGWTDDLVIFLLRAVPIMPTAPVSVVCGLIKIKLKTYLRATFLGTLVRNIFYLYLGFTGVNALDSINEGIDSFEKIGYVIFLVILMGLVFVIYKYRKNDSAIDFLDNFKDKFRNKGSRTKKDLTKDKFGKDPDII